MRMLARLGELFTLAWIPYSVNSLAGFPGGELELCIEIPILIRQASFSDLMLKASPFESTGEAGIVLYQISLGEASFSAASRLSQDRLSRWGRYSYV